MKKDLIDVYLEMFNKMPPCMRSVYFTQPEMEEMLKEAILTGVPIDNDKFEKFLESIGG